MLSPDSEEYRLLYTDEFGDEVGLDEVQLLDPPLEERVPALTEMLESPDPYLSYQAVLILVAWGKDIGLNKLEELIERTDISSFGFSPNRITGEDNIYDELSYSVHLYGLSEGDKGRMLRVFEKLLALYPNHFFESKLKHALLKNKFSVLLPAIESAINQSFEKGLYYQSSQLLPVLAQLDSDKGWQYVQKFKGLSVSTPDPAANIAEALKFCPTEESQTLLYQYEQSISPGVAEAAKNSLQYLAS
ncbi:MAG: hypothetical protein P8X79_23235 [Reinekea sp.]|jgi:hypothetical protein